MVLGRLLLRSGATGGGGSVHDPVAAIKALAITAALYALQRHFDPEGEKAKEWMTYASTPEARVPLALFIVFIVVVVNVLGNTNAIWRKLFFVSNPKTKRGVHRGCLIWLHGIGDRGYGFQWLRRELSAKEQDHVAHRVKIVLPDAPERVLKAASGSRKRAWFDLAKMPVTPEEPSDPDGLDEAISSVLELVEAQIADGLPAERIVLGGFSQGAALAAWAAARCPHKLGGVVLWSGYCPRAAELATKLRASPNGKGVPFVWAHGDQDSKILPACGDQLAEALKAAGVSLKSRSSYAGPGHGCTRDSLDKLGSLLAEVAPLEGLAAMKEVPKRAAAGGGKKAKDE